MVLQRPLILEEENLAAGAASGGAPALVPSANQPRPIEKPRRVRVICPPGGLGCELIVIWYRDGKRFKTIPLNRSQPKRTRQTQAAPDPIPAQCPLARLGHWPVAARPVCFRSGIGADYHVSLSAGARGRNQHAAAAGRPRQAVHQQVRLSRGRDRARGRGGFSLSARSGKELHQARDCVPGDRLWIAQGEVWLNGSALHEGVRS